MDFFTEYEKHVKEREALGVPPLPLNEEQTREVCELVKQGGDKRSELINLLANRVNPGVDDAAKVKAEFLNDTILAKNR